MIVLLLVVVVGILVFQYRRRNMYRLASYIPASKKELPVIGIAHTLAGNTENILKSLQGLSYEAMENDGVVRGWLGHILFIIMVNPCDLEKVLKTCLEKDDIHRFLKRISGNGGIFAPVPIWRRRRKILKPAFNPKIIESFVTVFSEQSEKLAQRLNKHSDAKNFSAWPFVSSYTFDSVIETAVGIKMNSEKSLDSVFLESINRAFNLITERIFHLWLQPEWLYGLLQKSKELNQCIKQIHHFTDEVITNKRKEFNAEIKNKTEVDHGNLGSNKGNTFLDLLILSSGVEKEYTNEELREEVLTILTAGTDTSAVAVGYTLKLLGKYPEIQDKVYQELYDVFGDSDRPLVKQDLAKLKYLERVVKESLRLFPPVPFIIRKVLEDLTLPSGRVLPAGSGVIVSVWGLHRDPKYWGPDAEHFDPDRFLPERFNVPTCSYIPFSSGPRNCLGYQYAMMSMKAALSSILRRFQVVGEREVGPIPYIRVKLDIMMKAVDGYELALERRTRNTST